MFDEFSKFGLVSRWQEQNRMYFEEMIQKERQEMEQKKNRPRTKQTKEKQSSSNRIYGHEACVY